MEGDAASASKPMSSITVHVKFAGRMVPVSVSPDADVADLKSLLQPLTNVIPRGQKLIFKGKVLIDKTNLKSQQVTDGSKVMLIASQGLHQGDGPITKDTTRAATSQKRVDGVKQREVPNTKAVINVVKQREVPNTKAVINKSWSEMWKLTGVITLSDYNLTELPKEVWDCGPSARVLDISNNSIREVPARVSSLKSLNKLLLNSNDITDESISWEDLPSLKSLTVLSLSLNHLTTFPPVACNLPSLCQLHITNNKLTSLPDEIGLMSKLQILKAANNRISLVPSSIGNCRSLIEIDFSCNLLVQLPETVGNLQNLKDTEWKLEKMQAALRIIGNMENLVVRISSIEPQWTHLMVAVDFRVEKNLLLLRSQALTDYRALLASIGWPPSFSSIVEDKLLEVVNPFSVMQGEKKDKFAKGFLVLCALQQLQVQHEARLNGVLRRRGSKLLDSVEFERSHTLDGGLWVINELVDPIASKMGQHLFKWADQPKFSFALVYKVTRDLIDGVDNLLQPLIDIARILGFGAKEAWVKAMVKVLSMHLEREVLPVLVKGYREKNETKETITSWIYLVDLMISFDKRMRDLGTSGLLVPLEEFSRSISIFSVFNGHLDWLHIWAEIEINDAEHKLKAEAEDESNWLKNIQKHIKPIQEDAESFFPFAIEEFEAPSIAKHVVKITWEMVERAGFLPNNSAYIL